MLELVRHWEVGTREDREMRLPDTQLHFHKVNAIHPGYAINHYPHGSCFRQLLILQFAKVFGIWRGEWQEERFMEEIRDAASSRSSSYRSCTSSDLRQFEQTRFKNTVYELSGALSRLRYFNEFAEKLPTDIDDMLVTSKLTWLLCDCGLFLRAKAKRKVALDQQNFRRGSETWLDAVVRAQPADIGTPYNLRDHQLLLEKRSELLHAYARQLQNLLFTWLRQINLGYQRVEENGRYSHDYEAYSNAMLRFASGVEDVLARGATRSRGGPSSFPIDALSQQLQGLGFK